MSGRIPEVEEELDRRVAELGLELVDVEWAGSSQRPVIRVRIDVPDSADGRGVSINDCAHVSRAVEPWLDGFEGLAERYVLEVSSPGVERPLKRRRDWLRFRGSEVAVRGREVLAGRAKRLEGVIEGLDDESGTVRLRFEDGAEVDLALDEIAEARLIYRWE